MKNPGRRASIDAAQRRLLSSKSFRLWAILLPQCVDRAEYTAMAGPGARGALQPRFSFASRTLVATLIVATRLLLLLATRLRRAARFDASAAAATLLVFIHVGRKLRQRRIVAAIGARDFLARRALDVA